MSSIVVAGDTSGSVTLQAPATAGAVVVTLPAVSGTMAVTGDSPSFTNLSYTGTLTGGTGVVNLGSGQFYKDASGNIGIGTSSPYYPFATQSPSDRGNTGLATINNASNLSRLSFIQNGTTNTSYTSIEANATSSGYLAIRTNDTERMRIDSSGNLLVGATTSRGKITVDVSSGNARAVNILTGASIMDQFYFNGSATGNISTNGVSASYNTSSDYRLKENIAPMTGALEVVSKLKPVTYQWKVDGSSGQGFIAHELQEVVPDCVTGEKDAMRTEKYEISPAIPAVLDEDGKTIKEAVEAVMGEREVPAYQGIDTSFLVATLTAAIQELNAKVIALEAQLAGAK